MIKRKKISYKFMLLEVALFALLLAIDLVSKYWVNSVLPNVGDSKVIIPDILTFIYAENMGASFGMLSDYPWIIMVVSSVTAFAMLIFMIVKRNIDKFLRLVLILILSGAIGNIYDRLAYGYVRDFIHYTFLKTYFNMNFAIGNVADIFLTVGAILLVIYVIFIYKDDNQKKYNKEKHKKTLPHQRAKNDTQSNNDTSDIELDTNVTFNENGKKKSNKRVKSTLEVSDKVEYSQDKDTKIKKVIKSDIEISQDKSFEDFEPIVDKEQKSSIHKGSFPKKDNNK